MTRLTDERIRSVFKSAVGGICGSSAITFARAIEAELSKQEPVANKAHWFALVMNAAAAIEDASNCLRDPDAKRAADGAAKHYRDAANALYTAPLPPAPDTVQVPREPTQDMLYAMAELDGWKRGDREHPMLTRWEDYWVAALAAAPKSTP